MLTASKPLRSGDESGAAFVAEMLDGDATYGINFDRLQFDSKTGRPVIIELLLCEERQSVTPWTSHPNRYYWNKSNGSSGNRMKFIRLWEFAQLCGADLILVNYAKAGTRASDEVRMMHVLRIDEFDTVNGPVVTNNFAMSRTEYSKRFRALNARGKTTVTESDLLRIDHGRQRS